jgi:pimeloyl-ACP methyl ester carboxylesterase
MAAAAVLVVMAGAVLAAAVATPLMAARRVRRRAGRPRDRAPSDWFALPDGAASTVGTADGADLAVHVAGPPDGQVVVLVHCWTGTKETWAPVARRLVRLGHRVVLYDQRGHGASGFGEGLRDVDVLGDDLAAVLEHVDARSAVVAGHSMGGWPRRPTWAARERLDASPPWSWSPPRLASSVDLFPLASRSALGDLSPAWVRQGRSGALLARGALGRRAVPMHVAHVRDALDQTAGPVRVSCLRAMARMDLRRELGELALPATVVVGSRDLLTPPAPGSGAVSGVARRHPRGRPGRRPHAAARGPRPHRRGDRSGGGCRRARVAWGAPGRATCHRRPREVTRRPPLT